GGADVDASLDAVKFRSSGALADHVLVRGVVADLDYQFEWHVDFFPSLVVGVDRDLCPAMGMMCRQKSHCTSAELSSEKSWGRLFIGHWNAASSSPSKSSGRSSVTCPAMGMTT